jgi:ribosomal protein S27AE
MELSKQAAYLKGLAEGMRLAEKGTDEAKILMKVIDMLESISDSVEELNTFSNEITELVDIIDEDLGDVESIIYDVEDDEEDDFDTDDDFDDEDEDEDLADESDFDEEDQEYEYEVTCPKCSNTVILPESIVMEGKTNCPNCGELLEFDLSEEE